MGSRLATAREVAGYADQRQAAIALGYTCGVHLCEFERGKRYVPHDVLLRAMLLYGVSADYLYGLRDDLEPDAVRSVQEAISGRIAAEVHHLAHTMAAQTADLVRHHLPSGAKAQRLAGLVLELAEALQRLRARCPGFDSEMPSSAVLLRMDLAAEAARAYLDDVRRAQSMQAIRNRNASLAVLTAPLTLPVLDPA